jgi:uncharacterized protein (DUF58 family)
MAYGPEEMTKLEFSARCIAMLGYLFSRQNDRSALAVFGQRLESFLPPGGGRKHLAEMYRRLATVAGAGETDMVACAQFLLRQVSRRSVVLFFSDGFQDPDALIRGLNMLALKGHEVLFFQVYEPSETDLDFVGFTQFLDLENGQIDAADPAEIRAAYRDVFRDHQQRLRDGLLRAGIQFHALPVCADYDLALANIIRERAG